MWGLSSPNWIQAVDEWLDGLFFDPGDVSLVRPELDSQCEAVLIERLPVAHFGTNELGKPAVSHRTITREGASHLLIEERARAGQLE